MSTAPQSIPEPFPADYTADNPQIEPEQPRNHRSTKPTAIKMQVIHLSALGKPKSHIAKELNLAHNTVTSILKEAKLENLYSSAANFGVNSFILDSVDTLGHHVGRKSLKAAMYVLDNTIFREEASNGTKLAVQVNVNIPRPQIEQVPTIEAKSVPELPNSSAQST